MVLLVHTEEVTDHLEREPCCDLGNEVERVASLDLVDEVIGEPFDDRTQRAHVLRREPALHKRAASRVDRVVVVDQHAGRRRLRRMPPALEKVFLSVPAVAQIVVARDGPDAVALLK